MRFAGDWLIDRALASKLRGIGYSSTSGYTGVSDSSAYGMSLSLVDAKAYPRVKTSFFGGKKQTNKQTKTG